MTSTNRTVRRHLLKPLIRRSVTPSRVARIEVAYSQLEERATARAVLPDLVAELKRVRLKVKKDSWSDPEEARTKIQLWFAMYLARLVSLQEYIFVVASASEGVHEGRIIAKAYPELEQFSSQMRQIQSDHSLPLDQFWQIKDAPLAYRRLSAKWSAADQKRLGETLTELEGQDASMLFSEDLPEFDRLRERGRRSFFDKTELLSALADTVKRYEYEARVSATGGAFTAAVTLLGAALEGLLLLRCMKSKAKAIQIAAALPKRQRPCHQNTPSRWTFDNLIQVCMQAGWLPLIQTDTTEIRPEGLAHLLRKMRNHIHPGKVCVESPWVEAERRDFEDAEVIYTILFATVFKGRFLKRYLEQTMRPSDHEHAADQSQTQSAKALSTP
jgi:hypothetical protein